MFKNYKELGDMYVAFFNQSKSDARRARRDFIKKFGKKAYDSKVKSEMRSGPMELFEKKPNRYTKWYVNEVAKNAELRVQRRKKLKKVM